MGEPGRLLSHFATRKDDESQKAGWAELWDTDESDLWDRGSPSIALIDWIESGPSTLPQAEFGGRLKALVPGCGKGYDVAMLALHGFDVVGLEISPKGAEVARHYTEQEVAEPHEYNFGSLDAAADASGLGNIDIVAGDFFDRSWTKEKFHLIYDYTFLCALHPDMREAWARRLRELVHPSGVIVCLEFPLYKDLKELGPPWPLKGVHWNLLAKGGDGKNVEDDEKRADSEEGPFARVEYFKPPRSYPNGKGTDMISVWRLNVPDAVSKQLSSHENQKTVSKG